MTTNQPLMQLSPQTCKLLKEKGFPQDTQCGIYLLKAAGGKEVFKTVMNNSQPIDFACPNAQEIWEQLPKTLEVKNEKWVISVERFWIHYSFWHQRREQEEKSLSVQFDSLVQGLADTWLQLVEEGLIETPNA